MTLIKPYSKSPVQLHLNRDLVRVIKRGHPWVFADALRRRPKATAGALAVLNDHKKGRKIANGFYTPHSPLAFRVCSLTPAEKIDDTWAAKRLERAIVLRELLFDSQTSGYRVLNGEGDGLPGLICDRYGDTAVLQLDGPGPSGFWDPQGLAAWLAKRMGLKSIVLKAQSRQSDTTQTLVGDTPAHGVDFLENDVRFRADIKHGQKTGFFLDQRDNRQQIKAVATDRRVLNLFGYTGGFSVYAGLGGAKHVTTVDLAAPALEVADYHWQLNQLPAAGHQSSKADVFKFLETAISEQKRWDLVIVDPPSFAPSKESRQKAISAYQNLIAAAATVSSADGLLAAASCSSHIDLPTFLDICQSAISKARRRATLLRLNQQPPDHPTPLPFPEFRYLKFVLMRVES